MFLPHTRRVNSEIRKIFKKSKKGYLKDHILVKKEEEITD